MKQWFSDIREQEAQGSHLEGRKVHPMIAQLAEIELSI